jgi:hypothetical protein
MGEITISRYGRTRFWAVRDVSGELICVCVYKRGAMEVARRLGAGLSYCLQDASPWPETPAEPAREPVRALPMAADQGEDPGSGSDRRLRAGDEDSLKNPWTISPSHPSETQVRCEDSTDNERKTHEEQHGIEEGSDPKGPEG